MNSNHSFASTIKVFISNKVLGIFILFMGIFQMGWSQYPYQLFIDESIPQKLDSGKLSLQIFNNNFFKNNEYFNKFVDGYTLLGFQFHPEIQYAPSSKVLFSAGVYGLKYSGKDNFTNVLPTFFAHYKPTDNFSLTLGTLQGTNAHELPEPLFGFDRYFENHVENGIQMLLNNAFVKADIWLNWESFILKNDPYQEKLTFGISSMSKPFKGFYIPLYIIVTHRGGQINAREGESFIETLANVASGLNYEWSTGVKWPKKVQLEYLHLLYNNLSPTKLQPYDYGYAIYPSLKLKSEHIHIFMGYFNGKSFITPRGEPIFRSVSEKDPSYFISNRSLVIAKAYVFKNIAKRCVLGAGIEGYYDTETGTIDYSFGLHLNWNGEFILKQF